LLEERGAVSALLIRRAAGDAFGQRLPQTAFGSLLRAYELVGYRPDRDYRFLEENRRLRAFHPEVMAEGPGRARAPRRPGRAGGATAYSA